MKELMRAAGAPPEAIDVVASMVDTCPVCRQWQHVGVRPISKTKIVIDFNMEVEVDLMFWSTRAILHVVDCCIRWSTALIIS
eukprot:2379611-Pyramimonas_sp.AAC.1